MNLWSELLCSLGLLSEQLWSNQEDTQTGIVARCEVSTGILVKIQSLRECVAVGTTILRNFGNCSPSDKLSLCRRCASSWLLCDYPSCSGDFLHVGLDITRVTSDNRSLPEAKI